MTGALVRIAVDKEYGSWNAPVADDLRFVYVPIPDADGKKYAGGCVRTYGGFQADLLEFYRLAQVPPAAQRALPDDLVRRRAHLDPDFDHLTYGDNGKRRGRRLAGMDHGDVIAFYAGLRPVTHSARLIYAIVGLYVVDSVTWAADIPAARRDENAHTRWLPVSRNDIVVRAVPGVSGRLLRCIPIGEWRDRAYRVRPDLLAAWGGLEVKDGYIQRSARPPLLRDPARFLEWFKKQDPVLVARNNVFEGVFRAASTAARR